MSLDFMKWMTRKRFQGLLVALIGVYLNRQGIPGGEEAVIAGLGWLGIGIMDAKGPIGG